MSIICVIYIPFPCLRYASCVPNATICFAPSSRTQRLKPGCAVVLAVCCVVLFWSCVCVCDLFLFLYQVRELRAECDNLLRAKLENPALEIRSHPVLTAVVNLLSTEE